jgi:hypothetical protein
VTSTLAFYCGSCLLLLLLLLLLLRHCCTRFGCQLHPITSNLKRITTTR